jgi:hypothetical protein
VITECGNRPHDGCLAGCPDWRQKRVDVPAWSVHLAPPAASLELGMAGELLGGHSRALAMPASSSASLASSVVSAVMDFSMMAISSSVCAMRSGLAAKRGPAARAGCLRMSRQKMSLSFSFWIPKETEPSETLNGYLLQLLAIVACNWLSSLVMRLRVK